MAMLSFVIPVYRNRETLAQLHDRVRAVLQASLADLDHEFLFVDDGSDDGSSSAILERRELDPRVKLIRLSRNFGQVSAIIAGLRHSKGDWTVIMSADLQDPPELVTEMVAAALSGHEVVICHRLEREDGAVSRWASFLFYRLMRFSSPAMPSGGFDYLLLSRRAAAMIAEMRPGNRFLQGEVLWLGFKRSWIPYRRNERRAGVSQWTLGKKLKYFLDGLVATSYWPIRLMGAAGVITAIAAFAYAVVVVWARVIHATPFKGFAPIVLLILTIGGVMMLMLALIAEYVWRIYDEIRGRPSYIVDREYL